HPAHVPHHRLGRHGAEGDDLAHRVAAVFFCHVINYAVTAVHAEVHVEVGHGHPFRVEETFEQQVVFQRVEIGDFQCVGDQRTRTRTPPRPYRHAIVLGPLDEVGNDKEVARESHLHDTVEFDLQSLVIRLADLGK